jgi:hypothetical protein
VTVLVAAPAATETYTHGRDSSRFLPLAASTLNSLKEVVRPGNQRNEHVSLHVAGPSAKADHQAAGFIALFYGCKVAGNGK